MAYTLASNAVNPRTGGSLSGNYLKIVSVNVDHTNKLALIQLAVWANAAAREGGLAPVMNPWGISISADAYVAILASAPVIVGTPAAVPGTVEDILLANVYAGLPACGDTFTQGLLVGAVVA